MKTFSTMATRLVLVLFLLIGAALSASAQFSPAGPNVCMAHTVAPAAPTTSNYSYTLAAGQTFVRWEVIGEISIPDAIGSVSGATRTIAVTSTGFGRGRLTFVTTASGCATEAYSYLYIGKSFLQSTLPAIFSGPTCVEPGKSYGYILSPPIISTAAQIAAGLADTYTWSLPLGATAVYSGDGSAAVVTMPASIPAGASIGITAGACNSTSDKLSVSLTVQPLKPSLTRTSGVTACKINRDPFILDYYAEAGVNYTWSIPNNWTIAFSGTNQAGGLVSRYGTSAQQTVTITPTDDTFGDINVTAEYATGGCGKSTADPYHVTRQLTAANTITPSVTGCLTIGSNVTFTVNGGFPISTVYQWTLPTGWASLAPATGNSITVPVGTGSGNVTVQVVNPATGLPCNNAAGPTLAVTVNGNNGCAHHINNNGCGAYSDLRNTPLVAACTTNFYVWTVTSPGGTVIASSAMAAAANPAGTNVNGSTFSVHDLLPTVAVPAGSIVTSVATNSATCLRIVTNYTTTDDYENGVSCRGVVTGTTGKDKSAGERVMVYPNPTGNFLQIDLPVTNAGKSQLTLVDALGRVVLNTTTEESRTKLDVRHLPAGIYTLRTTVPGGKQQAQSVVVQH